MLLLATMVRPASWIKAGVGVALRVGGLAYSAYRMWAGYRAPALGSTSAAKASLEWLAVPSVALVLLGLVGVLTLAAWEWVWPPSEQDCGPAGPTHDQPGRRRSTRAAGPSSMMAAGSGMAVRVTLSREMVSAPLR